jgi:biotin synthase
LIIGLGETEKEAAFLMQKCVDLGILSALFAFTPVIGTALASCSQPPVGVYRRVQIVRYLVVKGLARADEMSFDGNGRIVDFGVSRTMIVNIVESGEPFLTSGCPNCNRPFYNEKPGGPIYNYPRSLRPEELAAIKSDLNI